ncbi:NrsF family protein [Sphingomonas sp. ASY06-1R]|uniref:NrsF family protein n=1 Tax=Sphingomonas sp. ASY06-1R TaxID=3445771 RepID=UPI003FA2D75C
MTSIDALISTLSADLAPVRRRNMLRETLVLLALGGVELALILAAGVMRPDMGRMILSAPMMWKIGSLMLLSGVTCTIAIRSLAPPIASRRGLMLAGALTGLAILAGTTVASAAERGRPILERLAPAHGALCATAIVVLALPLMAALAVLMRRAAPVQPKDSALACGLAASTSGALIFTACCPMNDPLYIVVWYSVAIAIVAATARWLLPRHFRL